MKKTLLGILVLGFVFFMAGCAQKEDKTDTLDKVLLRGKLIVGVKDDTKPFGYLDENKKLVGFDIDLAKIMAKSILGDENKIEFVPVTPSNRMLALNSGKIDMIIATMTITPQRTGIVDFSRPYYMAGQAILVPQHSDITSLADLNGKKVIIVFGSTAEKNLRAAVPEAIIMGYKTYTTGFRALKDGMADAMTSDDTILIGYAMADKSVKLLPRRYSQEPYAVALKKGHESDRLKSKVDLVIEDLVQSGKLNHLKAKWVE